MSATETPDATDTTAEDGPKRLQPSQIAIIIGVAIAVVVAISGIASAVFQFHDDSAIQREVFGNVPGPLKLAFYTLVPVLFVYGAVVFSWRVRNWQRGGASSACAPASTCRPCCATPPPGSCTR